MPEPNFQAPAVDQPPVARDATREDDVCLP
jgi:hypothetical protein